VVEPGGDPIRVFNYDVFAVNIARATIRRITNTKERSTNPVWSPDGTAIAMLPTTAAHLLRDHHGGHPRVGDEGGRHRSREIGAVIDNRQGPRSGRPTVSGSTSQWRNAAESHRLPVAGRQPEVVAPQPEARHGGRLVRPKDGPWRSR